MDEISRFSQLPEVRNIPALRLAFLEGRIEQCEAVRELAQVVMHRNVVNPADPQSDLEKGIVMALSAIIEGCLHVEESLSKQETEQTFDA